MQILLTAREGGGKLEQAIAKRIAALARARVKKTNMETPFPSPPAYCATRRGRCSELNRSGNAAARAT
jgi:hypothetical protein